MHSRWSTKAILLKKSMPKLIDYPRTTYSGAWELAEITDDTGGKCAVETAARKLNRKVSGSFKAIIGSAVKFGLLTSKRDLLTTTTLFKRIKHAYDKQEELLFHREAFLTPPLFTQLCRKFRSRELPIQMLDVMLIREFGVEEINAQGVAKAFVEGCRMVNLLDRHNIVADIDALATKQTPKRELASPVPSVNTFRELEDAANTDTTIHRPVDTGTIESESDASQSLDFEKSIPAPPILRTTGAVTGTTDTDAVANLFGLSSIAARETVLMHSSTDAASSSIPEPQQAPEIKASVTPGVKKDVSIKAAIPPAPANIQDDATEYQIQISGPGVNTNLSITEEEDISLAIALLEKIRRQLRG